MPSSPASASASRYEPSASSAPAADAMSPSRQRALASLARAPCRRVSARASRVWLAAWSRRPAKKCILPAHRRMLRLLGRCLGPTIERLQGAGDQAERVVSAARKGLGAADGGSDERFQRNEVPRAAEVQATLECSGGARLEQLCRYLLRPSAIVTNATET